MSRDPKMRLFKFIGPTISYSYMQAVGMANLHLTHGIRKD
jgi:3-methyladenine DNA glycosylase Tag